MRVASSKDVSRGDVDSMAALAVQLRALGAKVQLRARRNCAKPLSNVGVPLVPIGVWR